MPCYYRPVVINVAGKEIARVGNRFHTRETTFCLSPLPMGICSGASRCDDREPYTAAFAI